MALTPHPWKLGRAVKTGRQTDGDAGPTMFARIGMLRALNHEKPPAPPPRRKRAKAYKIVRAKLLARKQQLLERLQNNPGSHERDEIERQLEEIDTALELLDEAEPGKSSGHRE